MPGRLGQVKLTGVPGRQASVDLAPSGSEQRGVRLWPLPLDEGLDWRGTDEEEELLLLSSDKESGVWPRKFVQVTAEQSGDKGGQRPPWALEWTPSQRGWGRGHGRCPCCSRLTGWEAAERNALGQASSRGPCSKPDLQSLPVCSHAVPRPRAAHSPVTIAMMQRCDKSHLPLIKHDITFLQSQKPAWGSGKQWPIKSGIITSKHTFQCKEHSRQLFPDYLRETILHP